VVGATKKTADDFFANFSRELDPGATKIEVEEVEPAGGGLTRKTALAVAGAVALLVVLWLLFGR
jgi:preprotein translocase subunit SecF